MGGKLKVTIQSQPSQTVQLWSFLTSSWRILPVTNKSDDSNSYDCITTILTHLIYIKIQ